MDEKIANLRWVLESAIKTFKRLFGSISKTNWWEERAKKLVYKAMVWNVLALITVHLTQILPT